MSYSLVWWRRCGLDEGQGKQIEEICADYGRATGAPLDPEWLYWTVIAPPLVLPKQPWWRRLMFWIRRRVRGC